MKSLTINNYSYFIQVGCCVLLGIILGRVILTFSLPIAIGIVIGIVIIIAITFKPEIGLIGLVIVTTTIMSVSYLPTFHFSFGGFYITDLIIIFLLSLVIFKTLHYKDLALVRTRIDIPILLLFVAAIISIYTAITKFGVAQDIAIRSIRWMVYYLVFFITTNLIREKTQLHFLINSIIVIATIVAIIIIIQSFFGDKISIVFGGKVRTLITAGDEYSGATRVVIPGKEIIYFSFFIVSCNFLINQNYRAKLINILHLSLQGLAIILIYSRNIYFTILIAMGVLLFLISKYDRRKILISISIIILILFIFIPLLNRASGKFYVLSDSFSQRITSLFDKDIRQETVDWRYWEVPFAIEKISKYPILGIGLGNSYRPGRNHDDPGQYIHNAYLFVLMYMGIIGFIPFLWLFIILISRGFRNWKKVRDPFLKAVLLGITLGFLGNMIRNMVAPSLIEGLHVATFGILMGINELIIKINRE